MIIRMKQLNMITDKIEKLDNQINNEESRVKVINRDMLKYIALILMGIGHMMAFIGINHFTDIPRPLFIEEKKLDKWTHNKAIQKSVESYRITPEQKEYLKSLKIK